MRCRETQCGRDSDGQVWTKHQLDMDHILVVLVLLWSSGLQADEEIDDIRLVGGSSSCSGELQVKHRGVWTTVSEQFDWSLKLAGVVCRHLDCGSVIQAFPRPGSYYSSSVSITRSCLNSAFTLKKCLTKRAPAPSPILEIICSDSVRLVNGTSLCSGRLEVKSNQQWSSVCEDDFDQQDAEVVCRELGCGPPSVLQGALYGEGEAPMWTKEFQCGGNESALLDCRSSDSATNTCSSGKAAVLTCSEPETVRLVRGSSRCDGELEAKQQGEWNNVYEKRLLWNLKTADTACKQLDCGSAVSTGQKKLNQYTAVWPIISTCLQSNSAVRECLLLTTDYSDFVLEVTCSESVRLVNGTSLCSGRLEVKSNQQWSSVCEDDFDQQDAEVVCRELGCGAPSVFQAGLYGEEVSPMWSKEFRCEGNESALLDCRSSDSARTSCSSGKAVGLTCSEPDDIRLVEGTSPCVGTFEMKHKGEWKPVAVDIFSQWDLMSAAVVCKQLHCGSALSIGGSYVFHPEAWIITSSCGQSESAIRECTLIHSDRPIKTLEITCSDSVRLVNGNSLCSGRLEVKYEQSWASVCEDDFSQPDAEVVCRELGCGAPSVLQGALYGEVEAPVWSNKYQCEGHESTLRDCDSTDSATNTCLRGKAVGLTCSEPDNVRLFGGTSRCHGTFEMKQRGEWRPVADRVVGWDQKFPPAVCRQLDCGSAALTNIYPSSFKDTLRLRHSCVDSGSVLRECLSEVGLQSGFSMEVICSDLLVQPKISLSTLTDGVSEAKQQEFHSIMGSNFTITCSTEPQFPGGSFQLIFTTSARSQTYTLPAVNHSAHFLFLAADHTHQGDYRCVYHIYVFSHNFSAESQPLHLTVTDVLVQPNISLSTLTDGVSEAKQQGFQVLMGSDFTITCSTEPQFPGGSFRLIFTTSATSQNYTLPAVNHSAHFLFLAADHTHQGDYRCVYHIYVFSHNFSAESQPLHLTVAASLTGLIFTLGVVLLAVMCGAALFFYYKATRGQKPNPENNIELDYLGGDEDGLDEEAGAQRRE